MEIHKGRLVDHVHVIVADIDASRKFYQAILNVLGVPILTDGDGWFAADELFVSQGNNSTARLHLAFQAPDKETVVQVHKAALGAGGRDNGAPGERSYHPGYYAAYALDPDGNNIEAVYHGPAARSAASVVFRPEI